MREVKMLNCEWEKVFITLRFSQSGLYHSLPGVLCA